MKNINNPAEVRLTAEVRQLQPVEQYFFVCIIQLSSPERIIERFNLVG